MTGIEYARATTVPTTLTCGIATRRRTDLEQSQVPGRSP